MGKERTFIFVGTRKGVMGNEKDADVYDTPGDPIPGWEENIARIKLMKGYEKVEVFEAGESTMPPNVYGLSLQRVTP